MCFLLRFSYITHTPRVCAAETRQLTKRVLLCSCSCYCSLFVELCVCTAVSPSFALTPRPLFPTPTPAVVAARFVYCYSHQCWTRVFPECLLCHESWTDWGTDVAEPVAVHCPGCNAIFCCFCAARCVFSVLFLSCFGTQPLTMAA